MRWITLVAVLMGLVLAPAASAAEPERADVVTHVFPETGHRVVAVALRYDEPLQLRRGSPARAAFTVSADGAPRTVVDVYSSPGLPGDDWRADARPGRYLIVELDPGDANAAVNGNSADGATAPRDLDGAYTVTQTTAFRDDRGRTLTPPPYALENDGLVQPVVDSFERRSFTDAAGTRLAFRLYRPRETRRPVPLVLVLHGGGETGSPQVRPANVTQITANRSAIVWATRDEPAYVVAPQLPGRTSQWTEPAIQAALLALLDRLAATYRIDTDRVYLTGLSRGGRGAVEFLANAPDRFAGSLLAAARAEDDDVSRVPAFAKVPLWLTHAIDDPVVP
jgi:predicted peptidase